MIWVLVAVTAMIGTAVVLTIIGPNLPAEFARMLKQELGSDTARPHPVVTEQSLAALPDPVRRYVLQSGAVGKPRPASLVVTYDAQMFSKPGAPAMTGVALQYDRFDPPKRLFFLPTSMAGLPVKVLHNYDGTAATMKVRVAGLYTMVDAGGPEFSRAETVTLLNDLCLFAPAWLTDPRLTWTAIDDHTSGVTFTNGPHTVRATLHFNAAGELVNFTSQDRGEVAADGTLTAKLWLTPLRDYRDFHGLRAASYGEAIWSEATGDFAYGKFTVTDLTVN